MHVVAMGRNLIVRELTTLQEMTQAFRIDGSNDLFFLSYPCRNAMMLGLSMEDAKSGLPTPQITQSYNQSFGRWEIASIPPFLRQTLANPPQCEPVKASPPIFIETDSQTRIYSAADSEIVTYKQTLQPTPEFELAARYGGDCLDTSTTTTAGTLIRIGAASDLVGSLLDLDINKSELSILRLTRSGCTLTTSVAATFAFHCNRCVIEAIGISGEKFGLRVDDTIQIVTDNETYEFSLENDGAFTCQSRQLFATSIEEVLYVANTRSLYTLDTSNPAAGFVAQPIPERIRQAEPDFCLWRAQVVGDSFLLVTPRLAMIRTADGEWTEMPAENNGSLSTIVPIETQAITIGPGSAIGGSRLFRGVKCSAQLGTVAERRIEAFFPDDEGTYVLYDDGDDSESTVEMIRLSLPDDEDYRLCWDRPLIPPLE